MKKSKCIDWLAIVLALSVSGAALAGPAGPGDAAAEGGAQEETIGESRRAAPAGASDDRNSARTVDLLIEMQGRSAGLTFNERTRRERGDSTDRAESRGAVPGNTPLGAQAGHEVKPPDTNRAGLFGSAAVPQVPVRNSPLSEARGVEPLRSSAAGPAGGARGDGSPDPVDLYSKLWLPRMLVQWIRDNRVMVISGAVLLLVAVWGSSVAASRRR